MEHGGVAAVVYQPPLLCRKQSRRARPPPCTFPERAQAPEAISVRLQSTLSALSGTGEAEESLPEEQAHAMANPSNRGGDKEVR